MLLSISVGDVHPLVLSSFCLLGYAASRIRNRREPLFTTPKLHFETSALSDLYQLTLYIHFLLSRRCYHQITSLRALSHKIHKVTA